MAKAKPNRAFLEALQQQKRRRGDETTGGGFETPAWFANKSEKPQQSASPAGVVNPGLSNFAGPMVMRRSTIGRNWIYAGAGSLAIVVIGVAAAAVIILNKDNAEAAPISAATEQVPAPAPLNGRVLDVTGQRPAGAPVLQAPSPRPATPPTGFPVAAAEPTSVQPPSIASTAAGRVVGMNYVIFTGFPGFMPLIR